MATKRTSKNPGYGITAQKLARSSTTGETKPVGPVRAIKTTAVSPSKPATPPRAAITKPARVGMTDSGTGGSMKETYKIMERPLVKRRTSGTSGHSGKF